MKWRYHNCHSVMLLDAMGVATSVGIHLNRDVCLDTCLPAASSIQFNISQKKSFKRKTDLLETFLLIDWIYKLTLNLRQVADPTFGVTSLEKRGTYFFVFLPLLIVREGVGDEFLSFVVLSGTPLTCKRAGKHPGGQFGQIINKIS